MLQYVLLFAFLGAARILYKIYFSEMHEKLKNFTKSPRLELPLIGHAYRLLGRSVEGKMMQVISDLSDFNDSTVTWVLGKPVIILNDPDDIRVFLNSPASLEKGTPFDAFYGNRMSLIPAPVHVWKPLRRSTNSIFSLSSMKYYMKSFNSCASKMVVELDTNCDNGEFDVTQTVGRCATNAAFKSHLRAELTDEEIFLSQKLMESGLILIGDRLMHYYYEAILNQFREKLGFGYGISKMEQLFADTFKPRVIKLLENLDAYSADENDIDYFLRRTVRMLQTGVIKENDLMENIGIFLVASSNTASLGGAGALLLLAMNPDVQEKLYEELKLVLNPADEHIDYDTINTELPYLDRVIKEALRLLPAIPFIARKPDTDITLSGGRIIPANTDVIIPIITIHRNRNRWGKDALRFNPDNFLPENISQKNFCTYLPYAYGQRNCIASKYATILIKVMVAYAIRKYRFSTKLTFADLRYGFAVTLTVNNGSMVSVTRRE